MEKNREEFIKNLKKGVAGALAGAAVLTGATGCEKEKSATPSLTEGVGREEVINNRKNKVEDLADRLQEIKSKEKILDIIKDMYVQIDNIKNPNNKLDKDNLTVYIKNNQTSCYYIEARDTIVLKGTDAWETELNLHNSGETYQEIGLKNNPMIIVANNDKTIDGIGSIPEYNIDEASITTTENLSKISAEEKTTAQEIPQELWENILQVAIHLDNNPDNYTKTVTIPNLCKEIAEDIYAYGLQDYLPDNMKSIILEDDEIERA